MGMKLFLIFVLLLSAGCAPKPCPCGECATFAHLTMPGTCASCAGYIPSISDPICARCAKGKQLCQHCGRPKPQ